MSLLRCTIVMLAVLAVPGASSRSGPAGARPHYERESRTGYIQRLVAALGDTDRATLGNIRKYIHVVDRNRCRSAYTDLRTSCLLEAARKNCQQRRKGRKTRQRCRLVSDIIVANKLGEKEFIDSGIKYKIMSAHREYRREIRKELWRRYAELVTEFSRSEFYRQGDGNLAAGIDGYCMQSVNQRHLSWQSCVAAVVWFVGTCQNRMD